MIACLGEDIGLLVSRVQELEAQAAIDRMIVKLRAVAREEALTVAHLRDAIDGLWWGEFGVLWRAGPTTGRARELRRYLLGRMDDELAELGFDKPVLMTHALGQIPPLPESERPMMELLALDPDWRIRPVTKAIFTRRLAEKVESGEAAAVPLITTASRLVERLLDESERATRE